MGGDDTYDVTFTHQCCRPVLVADHHRADPGLGDGLRHHGDRRLGGHPNHCVTDEIRDGDQTR